ncbi:hypothetical protein Q73_10610 [Bacillus coahuilensis m2-6]|uniref:tetratricopeptide repeat protein n=1 Tax=Bacillus coahuilensis TaxID=408580 RepID=UPI0001850850|nr:tetratricopeptide repeat protein [Bacillus coahuilensis]KUP06781.1 hypothetical protein Q73_10610 [Bacillus coahuilensis m2-6]
MTQSQYTRLIEEEKYDEAVTRWLQEYLEIQKANSLQFVKRFVYLSDEDFKGLIKMLDSVLMNRLAHILIRARYRRVKSPYTTMWYCDELIDENKLVESERLLKQLEDQDLSEEETIKLYSTMATTLMFMQRFKEASRYMEKLEELSANDIHTRWGYYYLIKGEWDVAVEYLHKGRNDQKDGAFSRYLEIHHLVAVGKIQKAQQLLNEAKRLYPSFTRLVHEQVQLHFKQKNWTGMLQSIDEMKRQSPGHSSQPLYNYYLANYYYENEMLDELQALLEANRGLKKSSMFKQFKETFSLERKFVAYTPVAQKYNYCMPACISMVTSQFGDRLEQDEIAEHVFEVSGSRIPRSVKFLEEQGFATKLFYGTAALYKKLIDQHVGMIAMIDYPLSSHVQVIVGYDDNLQCLFIQDPNFRELITVQYEDVPEYFDNNRASTIAVVPSGEEQKLHLLSEQEHSVMKTVMELVEKLEESPLTEEDHDYLQTHRDHFVVWEYAIRSFPTELDADILEEYIQAFNEQLREGTYKNIVTALAYERVGKLEKARTILEAVQDKDKNSAYRYVLGRNYYDQDDTKRAVEYFEKAIELEPDDHVMWSYAAMCYLGENQAEKALRLNEIALDINSEDSFVLMNQGLILAKVNELHESKRFFKEVIKRHKYDAHAWYERARIDERLGLLQKAERGYRVAIGLKPTYPYAYRKLADLFENTLQDVKRAEEVYVEAVRKVKEVNLLVEVSEFFLRHENVEEAFHLIEEAKQLDTLSADPWVTEMYYLQENDSEQLVSFIKDVNERFSEDSIWCINAGRVLGDVGDEGEIELSLDMMERGVQMATSNIDGAIEQYQDAIVKHQAYTRGFTFLKKLRKERQDSPYIISYIGCLYESQGYLQEAIKYFEQALTQYEDILPLYRLGEVYYKLEDYDKAADYYKSVAELDSEHTQALLDLASIASMKEEKDKELGFLQQAFRIDPYSVSVEKMTDLMDEEAVQQFINLVEDQKALLDEAFYYDTLAYAYGSIQDVEVEGQMLEEARRLSPDFSVIRFHQVKYWMKTGNLKAAKKQVLSLIEENVETRAYYETLLQLYFESKGLLRMDSELNRLHLEPKEKSLAFMTMAVTFEEKMKAVVENQVHTEQAGIFKRLVNFSKLTYNLGITIALYERAIKLDYENIQAVMWLTDFYIDHDLAEDAIKVLVGSLKKEWQYDVAYKLASVYTDLLAEENERKKFNYVQKTEQLLLDCLTVKEEVEVLTLLGYTYYEKGDMTAACEVLRKAIELEPLYDLAYLHMGRALAALGDLNEAETYLMKAAQFTQNPYILNELSIVYRRLQRFEEALRYAETCMEIEEDEMLFAYNRACYLSLLGRFNEARDELTIVFEKDETGRYLALSEEDIDLGPLKEARLFPVVWS